MTHGELVNEIVLALSKAGALVWKNHVGKFRAIDNPRRIVTVGLMGQSDILGCYRGKLLSVEVKVGADKLRPEQANWRDAVRRHGGLWVEARSVADALAILEM